MDTSDRRRARSTAAAEAMMGDAIPPTEIFSGPRIVSPLPKRGAREWIGIYIGTVLMLGLAVFLTIVVVKTIIWVWFW